MACFNLVSIFFIYLIFLYNLLIVQFTTAQPVYVYHFCLGNNYTIGSTFEANLNLLFSSISIGNRNYNTTIGQSPDIVYGSVQCRADVTLDVCQSCVDFATQDFNKTDRCPISKQAIIWYEEFMLRYSDKYYFNIMQDSPGVYMWNVNNVSNPEQFNRILGKLMYGLVTKATIPSFSANFATGNLNLTNHSKVYGLVQCTVDIYPSSCDRCLVGAIAELPNCCDGKQGGRVVRPSCYVRYESYPFLQYVNAPTPPLLSSPAPLKSPPPLASLPPLILSPSSTNTTTTQSKGNNLSILAVSIIVTSILAVLSAISFWFFCVWRKKTKTNKFDYFNDETRSTESLQFNFSTVSAATDNFSEGNELGKGGFGSVYKGTLSDGQEIAVKRLSKNSGQGEQEFKNEVTLVAKLQHRNLVKLVGFSLAGEEKLLIYEFMPNAKCQP